MQTKLSVLDRVWTLIKTKQFQDGLLLLKTIRPERDDWFLAEARCLQGMGKYQEAIQSISQNMLPTKATLNTLARCYGEMGQYVDALRIYHTIPNWYKDQITLLSLACCYEEMGWYQKAWLAYQELIRQFPSYEDAYNKRCHYAVSQAHPDAETLLEEAMQKWPNNKRLLLLKAQYQSQQGNLSAANNTLIQLIKKSPNFSAGYVALLRHYLFRGQLEKTEALLTHCTERFKAKPKLFSHMRRLLKDKFIIRYWGENYSIAENTKHLILPHFIEGIFKSLGGIPGTHRLVGNTLHRLLNSQSLKPEQDVNIAIFMDAHQFDSNLFRQRGFERCPDKPQFFSAKIGQNKIVCYVELLSSKTFIRSKTPSRNFSINSLFCDRDGNVSDPTGHGLRDLQNKILRTVICPKALFQKDAVMLLAAIEYMMTGYQPTPDLQDAAKNWVPDLKDMPHLYALKQQRLSLLERELQIQYEQLLQKFGLIQKIDKLTESDKETNSSFRFFEYSPVLRKGLTACAIEKAKFLHPNLGDCRAYLKSKLQFMPHLDALDLAKLKEKGNPRETLPAPKMEL